MEALSTTAQDDSSSANPSSVKSDDSSPRHEGGRGSPPPKCAICLGTCRNKSFTDSCLHQFCFKCLLTWSKVKAECPLCKQNFRSIIHNVRSNHQYEEYMVEQRQTEENVERIDIDNLTAAARRRFRYRTTLTLPRRETLAIQQLLMHHYPMMADMFPSPPPPRRRSPAAFRRSVYRYNLWARPLPDFTGRLRACSPEFYRYNDSQMHRLVPWLNRELHYLLNENVGHISYVMSRILELLPRYHINSSEFREAMQRYFGDRTEHFLHELYCFASTPYDMAGYDRNVQYTTDTRISSMINEVISSSDSDGSADSDIVMISSSEPAEPPPGPSRLPAPVYPQNYIPEPSTTQNNVITIETISQSDSDDDSSEVMVVGYIKPPQDRTPEVVDLLGSDSDVIVQDTPTQSEQPQTSESQEARPPPLVKLTLKKQNEQPPPDSDSETSTYTPPPPRRKKRKSSHNTNNHHHQPRTSTPLPAQSESGSESSTSSSYTPSNSSSSSKSSSSSSSESSSSSDESNRTKKSRSKSKGKRKTKNKRSSRLQPKTKNIQIVLSKVKVSKCKSYLGKGVKSSRAQSDSSASNVTEAQIEVSLDQPGTSGTSQSRKRKLEKTSRRLSRESKRLKSVVINIHRKLNECSSKSSSSSTSSAPNSRASGSRNNNNNNNNGKEDTENSDDEGSTESASDEQQTDRSESEESDSEDNIPLNLTITKTSTPL